MSLDWYPQGITTSADAGADGQYEGKTVILTSWYYSGSGDNKGVRVSFVDYANPSAPRYRHVLLVEPYTDATGSPNFRAVPMPAGGIVWYGHYLYVADTRGGFRVFDDGYVHGREAYQVDIPLMQGATAVGGTFYVSASRGASTPGAVYTFTRTSGPTARAGALPPGPTEAVRVWQRMEQFSKGQPPEFLSTHPSHGTRIKQLQARMPEALIHYQNAQPVRAAELPRISGRR
jgi:hypothetical protein